MKIKPLNLARSTDFNLWKTFLTNLGLNNFSAREINQIDYTIGIFVQDKLVATGSLQRNILKYIGTMPNDTGQYFNQIVSLLLDDLSQKQQFHALVFTKVKYVKSFQAVGFDVLAQTKEMAFLETGLPNLKMYLQQIPQPLASAKLKNIGAVVLHANPFTKGHQYLIKEALQTCDWLYVFVVSDDQALFTSQERLELVKKGLKNFKNVTIVAGNDYLVSYATFPGYFFPQTTALISQQSLIDALVFKHIIAPTLHIRARYLGSEPDSMTTLTYNKTLLKVLPPQVKVNIITRKRYLKQPISAHLVRKLITTPIPKNMKLNNNKIDNELLLKLVPLSTYQFICTHLKELRQRCS